MNDHWFSFMYRLFLGILPDFLHHRHEVCHQSSNKSSISDFLAFLREGPSQEAWDNIHKMKDVESRTEYFGVKK